MVGLPSVIEVLFGFRRTRRITDGMPVLQAVSIAVSINVRRMSIGKLLPTDREQWSVRHRGSHSE
jgi:hypothetical protein